MLDGCRKVANPDAVGYKPGKRYNNCLWSLYETDMVKICHINLERELLTMPIDGERYALLTFSHGKNKKNLAGNVHACGLPPPMWWEFVKK